MIKRQAGKLGGLATYKKHGKEHMREIGKLGARAFWKKYRLSPVGLAYFAIVNRLDGKVVAIR